MYVSKIKAARIIRACLNDMYRASDPPISWDECEKKYDGVENWFLKHEISEEKYGEIREVYLKQLPKMYHHALGWELLNYAPRFKKEK